MLWEVTSSINWLRIATGFIYWPLYLFIDLFNKIWYWQSTHAKRYAYRFVVFCFLLVTKLDSCDSVFPWVCSVTHYDVIKWRHFALLAFCEGNPPVWRQSLGHCRSPLTKACDAKLWDVFWSGPEQTIGRKIETPVIRDTIAPLMMPL